MNNYMPTCQIINWLNKLDNLTKKTQTEIEKFTDLYQEIE